MFMIFDFSQIQPFFQLLLAALLGGTVGLEREYRQKEAGFRTFALVSLGSCLFALIGINFTEAAVYPSVQIDLTRIIQAVAVGVGFIGAGSIIYRKFQVEGLTTAAALWAVAAIGIGVGIGLYRLSIFTTFLVIGILAVFRLIEERLFHQSSKSEHEG